MKYSSDERVLSGIPLGGIGSGKIEILPNGALDSISFQNNWNAPLEEAEADTGYRGLLGFHFGLWTAPAGRGSRGSRSFLLTTERVREYPGVDRIDFEGLWPGAKLRYHKRGSNLEITLHAMGTVRMRDGATSALPGALLRFRVKNTGRRSRKVSLLGIIRNTSGTDEIGRVNRVGRRDGALWVSALSSNPYPGDETAGETSLTVMPRGRGDLVSYLGQWNMQTKGFRFDAGTIFLKAFEEFSAEGLLPNTDIGRPQAGGGAVLGGALALKRTIPSGETAVFDFALSWRYPVHHAGHIHEKRFRTAPAVGRFILKDRRRLENSLLSDREPIVGAELPSFLKDALLNNLYVLTSTTWWDRNGSFAFFEAPVICPLMGTLDVRYYATVPFVRLFPELEKNEIFQFARAQRRSGYIPHDLGRNRLDNPNDGTTHYFWKDLNPKFILLACRDWLFLSDDGFLRDIYPSARKAMLWSLKTDTNGDCLPDNEGADQTYDVWEFFGTNSYTSSIFLASLLAMERMALAVDDGPMARRCRRWFEKGRESFIEELWNGRYFEAGWCDGKRYPASIAGQLNGQWYAHLLGLGYILPPEMVTSAVGEILRLNGGDSDYGVTNSVFPDGRRDDSNAHSAGIWPGESYAVASLAIYEGFVEEGLRIAEKTWRNMVEVRKNPWNQPDVVSAADGSYGFGDYYMRNMAVWAVLHALAARRSDLEGALEAFYGGSV